MALERVEGLTPAGGAYEVWAYFDVLGNDVPKEKADYAWVEEYDKDGDRIAGRSVVFNPPTADAVLGPPV